MAIARTLANEPRVILADEPTGNLDSTTADEVVDVPRSLSTDHDVTVIVVTHAEDVAGRAGPRIRLRDGRLVTAAFAPATAAASAATPTPAGGESCTPLLGEYVQADETP